jgi:alpha-beta hydrolase superfamily lysophospholipase
MIKPCWPTHALIAGIAFVVGHCTQAHSQANKPVPGLAEAARACSALTQESGAALGEPTARILTAKLNPRSESKADPAAPPWMGPLPPMPEHCEVLGVMRERTGSDGQHYAVKFHLRLPSDWNGRFLFQGGGGTNGVIGAANGSVQPGMPTGLEQGFAVVSTDTGHDNALNSSPTQQGTVAFGHDYQARLEYAEKALDSVATTAKRIVRLYYQRPAAHSFFAGCSNGGREGMVFAQRFPEQFDGIVAGSPAFAVPKAAVAEAWDTQTFAALAASEGFKQANGLPDIEKAFSDADLAIVADAVMKACDGADGAVDGMVQNLSQCTTGRVRPGLDARTCSGAKNAACLSHEQVEALVRSLGGPHDSQGRALYADWPWDVGIASPGWRMWKLGIPGAMDSINVALGSPALSGLFVTPPVDVADTPEANLRYQLAFNFDRDAPKIFGINAQFPRSGWDLVGAQSTDLERFRQHGGKLLVPHGGSDPIFSINDTLAWWRRLDAANHGNAGSFVRVYAVPGMNHCGGGPATDQFDALTAVVNWVERGIAPDSIQAQAGPMSPWPGRTRPLCPYPKVARYRSGDLNQASSFACETGKE